MENQNFIQDSWGLYLATLFGMPRYTCVPNTGTLSWTMPWIWHWAWPFGLKAMNDCIRQSILRTHFETIVIFQVYYFPWKLVHIRGLHAEGFYFLNVLSTFCDFFKIWSKWLTWLFIANEYFKTMRFSYI